MDRISLFPLEVVLFPGMPLPLRVFEPRYHQMLSDCEAGGQGFGVVLIRGGPEVGDYAVPHAVGTLAKVERRVDHGSASFLVARGAERFRIARTLRERPYLEGEVEWLPDPTPGEPPHEHAGHGHSHMPVELGVAALFEEYLRLLSELTHVPLDAEIAELLQGQRRASPWAVACAIGGTLLVAPREKQPILEAETVHDALHREQALLLRENARLRALAGGVSLRLN